MPPINDTANALAEKYRDWTIVNANETLQTITVEVGGVVSTLPHAMAIDIARDRLQVVRIRQLKRRLENRIQNALNQFEERTNLSPVGISLIRETVDGQSTITAVKVQIDTQL